MATPPTLDSDVENSFLAASTPQTVSVTAPSGRFLVTIGANSWYQSGAAVLTDPPTGGPTFTRRVHQGNSGDFPHLHMHTATSTGNYTHSQASTGSIALGVGVFVYDGSDGYDAAAGSQNAGSGVPQQAVTTTTDNCALVWVCSDGFAQTDASRDYLTVNGGAATEDIYVSDPTYYTCYVAHWADTGTAGSKTAGLNTYAGAMYMSMGVVAVKGAAGGGPAFLAPEPLTVSQHVKRGYW